MKDLVVPLIGLHAGGFAIPAGFLLGLSPIETLVAAPSGGVFGAVMFVVVGGTVRAWIIELFYRGRL